MRINHKIALNSTDPIWAELEAIGVSISRDTSLIWVAHVGEDEPAWPKFQQLILARNIIDQVSNVFTKRELDEAKWLRLIARGHFGYPQPEDDFSYIAETYDVSDYCSTCGIGGTQKSPFRLRREPSARHSQFLQLNWVFDEFFVRGEARQGIQNAGIAGVEFVAPVLHKSEQVSTQVDQMKVLTTLPSSLDVSGLQRVTCKPQNEEGRPFRPRTYTGPDVTQYCGRVKYHLRHRGPLRFDHTVFEGAPDIVKSQEWFGSGGVASRAVLVTQRFRQIACQAKWRGISFEPVEVV